MHSRKIASILISTLMIACMYSKVSKNIVGTINVLLIIETQVDDGKKCRLYRPTLKPN